MEHQLRIQRAAHHQKRALEMKQQGMGFLFFIVFTERGAI